MGEVMGGGALHPTVWFAAPVCMRARAWSCARALRIT